MEAKAIIFDMDGVLVDTEILHSNRYIQVLREYGISLTEKEYYNFWTRDGKGIKEYLEVNSLPFDHNELRKKKRELYQSMLKEKLELLPGAMDTVKTLSKIYPLALVTSSYREETELILNLTHLKEYFSVVITGNDVTNPKPHPEGFLLASKRLNMPPSQTLVIEDAEKGVVGAHKAGMKVIALPNKYTKNNDFSYASIILPTIRGCYVNSYFAYGFL
jgi:HAD superfamily hydrolase (TIGR01509 family)